MKLFKKIKPAYIALTLILIFLGSTIASGVLQSVYHGTSDSKKLEVPTSNIVEYELTTEQEEYLMSLGKTIIKFKYKTACLECLSLKSALESLTNQFSDQLILEEIITKEEPVPSIAIMSYYGQKFLDNPTQDEITDAICDLMIKPPTACIARKV